MQQKKISLQTTTNVSIHNYHSQFNKSLGFNRNSSFDFNVIALFSTHSPTHLRHLSWEKLFCFLVIEFRVLYYHPSCHRFFHLSLFFEFVAIKITLRRWQEVTTAERRIPPLHSQSERVLCLQIY